MNLLLRWLGVGAAEDFPIQRLYGAICVYVVIPDEIERHDIYRMRLPNSC